MLKLLHFTFTSYKFRPFSISGTSSNGSIYERHFADTVNFQLLNITLIYSAFSAFDAVCWAAGRVSGL